MKNRNKTENACLLGKNDFSIIETEIAKYLFLVDSLRFFRIEDPKVMDYFQ
ncbi:MAG: hypothetical protein LBR64_10035 [Dysgonamonadaceae bacterium]|nr:hypothetical protein [Dysgonamonadaceae bacterium]